MTDDPVIVGPGEPISACAEAMRSMDIRHLAVVNATGTLAGIVADVDIFEHGRFEGEAWVPNRPEAANRPIAPFVRAVETAPPQASQMDLVRRLFGVEDDVLVIVDKGNVPVGIFTEYDAISLAASSLPAEVSVADVMATALVTGSPDTPLREAWALLDDHRIRHLPVREGDRLLGIVSRRDLVIASGSIVAGGTLDQLIRPDRACYTAPSDMALREAARAMAVNKIGCLPVLAPGGSLEGLVTASDLVKALLRGDLGP